MKKTISAWMLTGLASVPVAALAEDSPHTLSGNVSLTSDYIFRGISQTGGGPAIQGGLDYSHASGLYVGTWASNVGWIQDFQGYKSGSLELDLYGGYRNQLGDTGVSYDLGAIGFLYPGERGGAVDADTVELYASLGWKWFTVKYNYSISDETFGFANSDGSGYLDLSASLPVGETGLTLGAHWGTFNFENNPAQDYDDYKLSATYDMGKLAGVLSGVTAGVAYSDTDAKRSAWTDNDGEYLGDDTVFFWVSKAL